MRLNSVCQCFAPHSLSGNAKSICLDRTHSAHTLHRCSGGRCVAPKCRIKHYRDSFLPTAIVLLNKTNTGDAPHLKHGEHFRFLQKEHMRVERLLFWLHHVLLLAAVLCLLSASECLFWCFYEMIRL